MQPNPCAQPWRWRESRAHRDTHGWRLSLPSKLLCRNLVMTDLCVAIIVQPLQITHLMSAVNEKWDICDCTNLSTLFIGRILCAVSLLTASVISVDRLFALLLGLRCRQFVTLKRACETVIVFWFLPIVSSSAFFLNLLVATRYQYIVTALCLVTTMFSYKEIFFTLTSKM